MAGEAMEEDRIVTELFLERPSFKEVAKVAKALEVAGVKSIVMPPEDRSINTHLIVENADLPKIRPVLKKLGVNAMEKEVIIIRLENRPGTMADAAKKISDRGINLVYAFSVTMTPTLSYVLLGASDNKQALKALSE
ncbi:ACT domain-containing protein [Candidatus Micrarchaeota archaeon]|nr:ACT domain-containing protein [Candidatus Micrarchaeota archaeon]